MYNDTRSATIATMPGCRDLRLRPALRLHLAGRENSRLTPANSRFADTSCFERRRALSQTASSSCRRCQPPARSHAIGIHLRMPCVIKNDSVGQFPFFAGGNRSRRETGEIWSAARSGGDDQARRTNLRDKRCDRNGDEHGNPRKVQTARR